MINRVSISKLVREMKLDVGCGKKKKNGFIGLDIIDFGQEIVWDVCKGIPLPDNVVSEICCDNVLEHVPQMPSDLLYFVLQEFYRVCKSDAKVFIIVPHSESPAAWQDPTHTRAFNERSYLYFGKQTQWAEYYGYSLDLRLIKQEVKGDMDTEAFVYMSLRVNK